MNKSVIEIRKQVGQEFKEDRINKGYTRYQLAKLSRLSQGQVKDIEEGSVNFTFESLVLYMKAIDRDTLSI